MVVNPDDSGHYLPSDPVRPGHISGPDRTAQAVGNIVGNGYRLVLGVKGQHADHRAKNFLLRHGHLRPHFRQNGGLDKVAVRIFRPRRMFPAIGQPRPLLLRDGNIAHNAVIGRLGYYRPHLRIKIRRVAQADGGRFFRQPGYELIIDGTMHHGPGALNTGLPGGHKGSKGAAVDRILQVGIGKDDDRGFAA